MLLQLAHHHTFHFVFNEGANVAEARNFCRKEWKHYRYPLKRCICKLIAGYRAIEKKFKKVVVFLETRQTVSSFELLSISFKFTVNLAYWLLWLCEIIWSHGWLNCCPVQMSSIATCNRLQCLILCWNTLKNKQLCVDFFEGFNTNNPRKVKSR